MAARQWLSDQMVADGLAVRRDGVANIFGRFGPAKGPSVLIGSHLDTVPDGGAFDGALGVCVALECIRAMQDQGIEPDTAVELVATAEEEGRFGGMLGAQTITSQVDRHWLETATDENGISLVDAMAAQGLNALDALDCGRDPDSIKAFLELHIEQGPVLETGGVPIGIADSVSGVSNISVRLEGKPNHSGTTPMDLRADAFAGLAEIGASIPRIISASGTGQTRMTIGKADLYPNFPHTIAGIAEFSVITRDTDEAVMRNLLGALKTEIEAACTRNKLTFTIEDKGFLAPTALDPTLVKLIGQEAEGMALDYLVMPSGAGHDAQTLQALCPSGLIFIPSQGGVSHAPEEWSDWEDIEKGAQLMLRTVIKLSSGETG